jgi:hypothetical protein
MQQNVVTFALLASNLFLSFTIETCERIYKVRASIVGKKDKLPIEGNL